MRAKRCLHCGWVEVEAINLTPSAASVLGQAEPETARRGRSRFGYKRDESRCVLCGKSRQQARKLIMGIHGGVCVDCIALCNEIIEAENAPPPPEENP